LGIREQINIPSSEGFLASKREYRMSKQMTTGAGIATGLGSIAMALAACMFFYMLGWSPGCHYGASPSSKWSDCKDQCEKVEDLEARKLCKERCFEFHMGEKEKKNE
jgi:hypothetical protein